MQGILVSWVSPGGYSGHGFFDVSSVNEEALKLVVDKICDLMHEKVQNRRYVSSEIVLVSVTRLDPERKG